MSADPLAILVPDLLAANRSLFAGLLVSFHLLGFLSVQTSRYFTAFKDDRWIRKAGVLMLLALNLWTCGTLLFIQYFGGVLGYQNPSNGLTVQISTPTISVLLIISFVVLTVQLFYLEMCWKVHGKARWILPVLGSGIAIEFFVKLGGNIRTFTVPRVGGVLRMISPQWQLAGIIVSIIVDGTISLTLTIGFLRLRTGKKNLDSLLVRLARGIFESAIVPIVILCITIIFRFYRNGSSPALFGIVVPLAGIYAVTLLHTLLLRVAVRKEFKGEIAGGTGEDIVRVQPRPTLKVPQANRPSPKEKKLVAFTPALSTISDPYSDEVEPSKEPSPAGFVPAQYAVEPSTHTRSSTTTTTTSGITSRTFSDV